MARNEMCQEGIFWNIEFHAPQTSKRMKHPAIKTSAHPLLAQQTKQTWHASTVYEVRQRFCSSIYFLFYLLYQWVFQQMWKLLLAKRSWNKSFLGQEQRDRQACVLIRQWWCPWESICSQSDYYNICLSGNITFVGLELECENL